MKFVLNITCDNDAFHPDPTIEVTRLLRAVARQIEQGDDATSYRTIHDANGNDVGRFKLVKEPAPNKDQLILAAVAKIDNLVIERGGRELGELGLNALHELLTKLVKE